jgi:hypothetical protein
MLTSTETGWRRSQIFYRMREFIGSREAIVRAGRREAAAFYRNRQRVPITCAKEFGYFRDKGVAATSRGAEALSWPACRSRGGGSRLYSISEKSVSRLSLLESSSTVSPAWSKHRRQSPLFTRNAVSQRGHSSGSCVIAGSRSVKP